MTKEEKFAPWLARMRETHPRGTKYGARIVLLGILVAAGLILLWEISRGHYLKIAFIGSLAIFSVFRSRRSTKRTPNV